MTEEPSDTPPESAAAPALSREERRIRAAEDALRTTIRDLYAAHFSAGHQIVGPLELSVSVRVDPPREWALSFSPPLEEQVLPQLADAEATREVYRQGRVFCFRCLSNDCEHAGPGSGLQVFKGYDPNGRPAWQELSQLLIERKIEQVDRLYANPPAIASCFIYGRDLKGQQLSAFGKGSVSYSVLGQVAVGYYLRQGDRMALSIQAVEGRTRDGSVMLRLNPVVHGLEPRALDAWVANDAQAPLYRGLKIAGRELERVEQGVRTARAKRDHDQANRHMGRVPVILRRLAEGLERGSRQGERRTRHVENRRKDQRPVHKALEDAAAARADSCYFDQKSKTYVVVGDRGRAHAFSEKGRHVTSFMLKPSAVASRVRKRRWRLVQPDEWKDIRPSFTVKNEDRRNQDHDV